MIAQLRAAIFLGYCALALVGCGGSQHRTEGIEELKKIQTAIDGLHILVSAGVTKQEYSQRLEDALLKAGDIDQSAKDTLPKFPKNEQNTVIEIYGHFKRSIDAFKTARDYFGDNFTSVGCEDGCATFTQGEYDGIRKEFPTLPELKTDSVTAAAFPGNPSEYRRGDMLRALWELAAEEEATARKLLETVVQS
jgi:hypothetical protein